MSYRVRKCCLAGVWALAVALAATAAIDAHDDHDEPERVPKKVEHKPTALPDRIILSWTGDPARSQAVTWRTDTTVKKAVAQIAVAEANSHFESKSETVKAVTTPLKADLGPAHYHSLTFMDLTPSKKYCYRVGDSLNWSEWIHFKTASTEPEPFSFIYFGDAQNDVKAHWSRVIREAYSDAPKASFIIHAGDLINRANLDAQWGEWFRAGGWLNSMVPNVPTPGNHEYYEDTDGKNTLSWHWRPQFALPEHGPKGLEESVYYIDYQGMRIVSLNSNEKQAEQVPWLESVLSNNPNKWTVLTFHHPVYSAALDRDNRSLRNAWQPIFDTYRVDLVLTGHDHTYARSGLMKHQNVPLGASVRDSRTGTVYVTSVSGPKHYKLNQMPWMQKTGEGIQLYQIIHVTPETMRYEARTATGEVHDVFELRKRPNGPNELIELELDKVSRGAGVSPPIRP